jgi:hypothetical protein
MRPSTTGPRSRRKPWSYANAAYAAGAARPPESVLISQAGLTSASVPRMKKMIAAARPGRLIRS